MKEKYGICEELNKGVQYDSQGSCWFKPKINSAKDKKNEGYQN